MKIAAAVAVIGAVLAESAGSTSGLGHLVVTANAQLESARAFAATALLIAEAVALYALFAALERRVVNWAPRTVMKRLSCSPRSRRCVAGCGEKAEPTGDRSPRARSRSR